MINKICRFIVCGLLATLLWAGQSTTETTAIGGDPMYTDAYQNEPADYSPITIGTSALTSSVLFTSWVAGDNPTGDITLCVETQPIGTDFTNVATACGTSIPYDSPLGFEAMVLVPNQLPGNYHWQGYAIDDLGNDSDWMSFGFNEESEIDYTINAPVVVTTTTTTSDTSTTSVSVPANATLPVTGANQ